MPPLEGAAWKYFDTVIMLHRVMRLLHVLLHLLRLMHVLLHLLRLLHLLHFRVHMLHLLLLLHLMHPSCASLCTVTEKFFD